MDNIKSNKLNTHFYRGAENHNLKFNRRNIKLEKHNIKPVNVIFIIALSLLGLTSVSAFGLMSSNSHAETTSAQASVTVPDTCYMSSTSTTHTDTATGGSYKENFGGESTVTVICNDRNGYSVYAIGCSGSDTTNCSDTDKTKLIGSSTNLTIPTGLSTDGSTSNWAMKLTPGTGSFAPTILNGYNNYSLVPATATKVATLTSDINVSNSSQFKTSYAVAIASSQAADTYVGKVKYTVVHPNYVTPSGDLESYPVTLGFGANTNSIIIDGTTYTSASASPNLEYGTHTISGTYPSGYEFSSWSSTGNITIADSTSASTTIGVTGAGTLTLIGIKPCTATISGYMQDADTADSYCDGATGTMTDKRDNQTYTIAKIADALWMTRNLAIGCNGTGSTYGSSVSRKSLTSSNSNVSTTWSTPTALLSAAANSSATSGYTTAAMMCNSTYGAWYNYVAATAGTISGDSNQKVDTYNICPKGWTLPRYNTSSPAGSINSITSQATAFSPVKGGIYNNGSNTGASVGFWWSATARTATGRHYLFYNGSILSTESNYRYAGLYVRCVRSS